MDVNGPQLRRNTAIRILAPASAYNSEADGTIIKWLTPDIPQPSEADIQAKMDELKIEYDAQEYARTRAKKYPNLAEQFDLLWHAIDADTLDKTSDFYTTLKAVKDAHPKG